MSGPNFIRRFSIGPKLVVILLLVGIVPLAIVVALTFRQSSSALSDASEAQLEGVAAIKAAQVERWFSEQRRDVYALTRFNDTHEALEAYAEGYENGVGSRQYAAAQARFDGVFDDYRAMYGYYDAFLIATSGDIIYSAVHESDFGTNLLTGPYAHSGLADAFRGAVGGEITVTDLAAYAPSGDIPASFIAAPVYNDAQALAGVVAFQMRRNTIAAIMGERSGLGETGETILVGPDFLLRSDSRFAAESTVLRWRIDTVATRAGLRGEEGAEEIVDYRGVRVLAVWRPLDIAGLEWMLVAKKDLSEIGAPSIALRDTHIAIGAVAATLIVAVAALVSRQITRPVVEVRDALEAVAAGDFSRSVNVTSRDEVGDMARSYERMQRYLSELADLADRVAQGDLEVYGKPRSEQDTLGIAFGGMVENLRNAAAELHESEVRKATILDHAPVILFAIDSDGRIMLSEGKGLATLGVQPGEHVGRNVLELYAAAPEGLAGYRQALEGVSSSRIVTYGDLALDTRWDPFRNEQDQVVGVTGVVFDVTDREGAAAALRESEERYRDLYENAMDIIFTTDLEGRITSANTAAERMSGYARKELQEFGPAEWVRPDHRATLLQRLSELKEGTAPTVAPEVPIIRKDGGTVWLEARSRIILDGDGQPSGVHVIARDVTERRQAEGERQLLHKELNRRADERHQLVRQLLGAQEEERRQVAYDIHDGPAQQLAGAEMYLEAFLADRKHHEGEKTERRLELVSTHLSAALHETQRIMSSLRPALLDELGLVGLLKNSLPALAGPGDVEIDFRADLNGVDLSPTAEIVLFRVAQEAVGNAVRHSGTDRVRVELRADAEAIALTVQDWGTGFDPDAEPSPREGSHRLGLVGMRERTELLGGGFTLRTSPGEGTTITATLPAHAAVTGDESGSAVV